MPKSRITAGMTVGDAIRVILKAVPVEKKTMTRDELRNIEVNCRNTKCGDPVPGRSSSNRRRRMTFAGFWWFLYAKYRCPDCPETRFFRSSFLGGSYHEVRERTARFEIRAIVTLALTIALVLWSVSAWQQHKRSKARHDIEEAQAFVRSHTAEFNSDVEVTPEWAEVYKEKELQVLLSVRLRADAKVKNASFLPVSGYFLDQDGTRYDPHMITADGTRRPLEEFSRVDIVPGQKYRYYLTAPVSIDPTSSLLPSKRLTKLRLGLKDSAQQEVPVVKHAARQSSEDD